MKKLLYIAAACSSLSLFSAVDENLSLENLAQVVGQSQMQAMFDNFVFMIRQMQDLACSNQATLEQIKEELSKQLAPLKNIPNDNSEEAYMLRSTLSIFKEALKVVAEATRGNRLPAVNEKIFKKGVDAQATRLKVVECIESFLK